MQQKGDTLCNGSTERENKSTKNQHFNSLYHKILCLFIINLKYLYYIFFT